MYAASEPYELLLNFPKLSLTFSKLIPVCGTIPDPCFIAAKGILVSTTNRIVWSDDGGKNYNQTFFPNESLDVHNIFKKDFRFRVKYSHFDMCHYSLISWC